MSKRNRPAIVLKRAIDVMLATAALVLLSPLLGLVIILLLIAQGRPVLFRQWRPGLGGRPFLIIKLRTMRPSQPGEIAHLTDEQRTTRLGRLLRATSIDELPELVNVIKGEMSLVGPRPLLMDYLALYTERQQRRHSMRPGVTSWAAVNGRHSLRFEERLELDVWYVEHWSLALDFRIMAKTLIQVLRRADVRTAQSVSEIGFPLPADHSPVDSTAPTDHP